MIYIQNSKEYDCSKTLRIAKWCKNPQDVCEYTGVMYNKIESSLRKKEISKLPIYYKCKHCDGEGHIVKKLEPKKFKGSKYTLFPTETSVCLECLGQSLFNWIDIITFSGETIEVKNAT